MRTRRFPAAALFIVAAALADGSLIASYLTTVLWLDQGWHEAPRTIGLLGSISSMAYVALVVYAGHWADRVGRRRMAIVGPLVMGLGNLTLLTAQAKWQLIAGLMLRGTGSALFWPALAGWLTQGASPNALPRRLCAYNLGWCGGQVVGLAVSGLLFKGIGSHAFAVYSVVGLLLSLYVTTLPTMAPDSEAAQECEPTQTSTHAERVAAWAANFAGFFVLGQIHNLFPTYAREHLGLGPALIGFWISGGKVLQLSVFFYLGLVRPRLARGRWLVPTQALTAVGLLALAQGSAVGAALGVAMASIVVAVANTASLFHSLSGRDDSSKQSGIHETLVGIGGILGPVLGGRVAGSLGWVWCWRLGALVMLSAMLAAMALTRPVRAALVAAPAEQP